MGRNPVRSVQTIEYDTLIAHLRRARENAGVSQRQLSQALGQAHHYIATIEEGSRRMDMVEFVAIVEMLKLDPEKIFYEYLEEIGRKKR